MDYAVPPVRAPLQGHAHVPPSKSFLQRALVLSALSDDPVRLHTEGPAGGDDVVRTRAALQAIGSWQAGALGTSRGKRALDLGWNGTGFRFLTAAACLRPAGARTLVGGRPALLRRPHRSLRKALTALGGHVRRRPSGAMRVVARPLQGGRAISVDVSASSQYVSALALIAPRIGGLVTRFAGPVVSRPYLRVTVATLAQFGIAAELEETALSVPAGVPRVANGALSVEPDASAAAFWFAAAALVGGSQSVVGLQPESVQADLAMLDVLTAMGATVDTTDEGWCRVRGSGERLRAPGHVDLRDATDLVPLVAALAATADGDTWIAGAGHARRKESDRLARVAQHIRDLGGDATLEPDDVLHIRGRQLHGARIDVRDDHRLAFAFGLLGMRVPGVTLAGAQSATKSDPGFLAALARAAAPR